MVKLTRIIGLIKFLKRKINRSTYVDVFLRTFSFDPIVKVICTKPKGEKILTLHLSRRDSNGEYHERILIFKLVKYGNF